MENLENNTKIVELEFEIQNLKKENNDLTKKSKEYESRHNKLIIKIYNLIDNYKNNIIDIFVSLFFILNIIFSSIYAIIHSYSLFFKTKDKDNELLLIEELFLIILPVFIFVGFYIYYLLRYRNIISTNKEISSELKQFANKSLHLTKSLFLSSIISYTIIKILDAISKESTLTDTTIIKLISYGLFFLILLFYYLKMLKKNE